MAPEDLIQGAIKMVAGEEEEGEEEAEEREEEERRPEPIERVWEDPGTYLRLHADMLSEATKAVADVMENKDRSAKKRLRKICDKLDELRRKGFIDEGEYKELMSIIDEMREGLKEGDTDTFASGAVDLIDSLADAVKWAAWEIW